MLNSDAALDASGLFWCREAPFSARLLSAIVTDWRGTTYNEFE